MQKGKEKVEKGKAPQPVKVEEKGQANTEQAKLINKIKEDIGITPFIEEKFQVHIQEGLKEIVHNRPEDPIKFLGQFLLKRSEQIK